jgi:hypothetical protein
VVDHGGAVGTSANPTSPITFASRIVFRNFANRSCRRRYTQSRLRPITENCEFQYVQATIVIT